MKGDDCGFCPPGSFISFYHQTLIVKFTKLTDRLTGIPGQKGEPGNIGQTGFMGPQGQQGITGPRGDRGTSGRPGLMGLKGQPGSRGAQGMLHICEQYQFFKAKIAIQEVLNPQVWLELKVIQDLLALYCLPMIKQLKRKEAIGEMPVF